MEKDTILMEQDGLLIKQGAKVTDKDGLLMEQGDYLTDFESGKLVFGAKMWFLFVAPQSLHSVTLREMRVSSPVEK